jgi:hypothetical protein
LDSLGPSLLRWLKSHEQTLGGSHSFAMAHGVKH